ncbi:MAG: lysoplasmalogenase [Acidimicrobiales bacterium]|nr:lysoplasmalogenase [Acidimicrobiales bacterium]
MTNVAAAWFAVAGVCALADWASVARAWRPGVAIAKPLVLLALIAAAVTTDAGDTGVQAFVVVALVFSLMGDIFLELEERFFIAGLVSFLIAHLNYLVALLIAGSTAWFLLGLLIVAAGAVAVGRRVASGAGRLSGAVWCYVVAISAMVVAAFGTASGLAIGGAVLFYASDGVLGWNRFVTPLPQGRLAVHATYHLGQAGLVAWLATV